MSGHVVTVVRDVAGHASSHSYAGVCTRTGQVQGNDEINNLSQTGRPLRVSAAEEGPISMISKHPIQFSESICLSTVQSAPTFSLCWTVTAVIYAHLPPQPAMYMGRQQKASERVKLHLFTLVMMRAFCYARAHNRVAGARM